MVSKQTGLRAIHGLAGVTAFAVILTFWTSTIAVELLGDGAVVAQVKTGIVWGLVVLVPAIAMAGASGFRIAGTKPKGLAGAKLRRMKVIGTNGVLVLVPCALFLAWKAKHGRFDDAFVAVQAIELVAGAVNLTLMGLNMRDGIRLTSRFRDGKPRPV